MKRHDYRAALRVKGIRPLRGVLRTIRKEGDVEIVFDFQAEVYRRHEHGGVK